VVSQSTPKSCFTIPVERACDISEFDELTPLRYEVREHARGNARNLETPRTTVVKKVVNHYCQRSAWKCKMDLKVALEPGGWRKYEEHESEAWA
jgi:hypothetical protein